MFRHPSRLIVLCLFASLQLGDAVFATDQAANDFFEKEVRPLLIAHCNKCHGDKAAKGGLRLTSRADVLRGGGNGPAVVAGKPAESLLLQAVHYQNDLKMPPKGKLTDREIKVLERWVQMGLPWPEDKWPSYTKPQQPLWSFQPVRKIVPSRVKNGTWVRSPVDQFILAKLEERGLAPSAPADKRTLLRRVTFDLIGLPPTPEEIRAFLEDPSPDAFTKVVDRLLASSQYGERWGRHWLDLVHYADGDAFSINYESKTDFPEIWRYRDWVTKAFNRDMSYTDFLTLQIAGDLLPSPQKHAATAAEAVVATGMLAMTHFDAGGSIPLLMNADFVDDQVDIVGRALLGLTVSCARCHDHKFDPISTEDYYSLAGIFFNTRPLIQLKEGPDRLRVPLPTCGGWPALSAQIVGLLATSQVAVPLSTILALNPAKTATVTVPNCECLAALQDELKRAQKHPQPLILQAVAVQDGGLADGGFGSFRDAHVYVRGNPFSPGKIVPRGVPRALGGDKLEPIKQESGRLQLAHWLTRSDHPLTARVMVNRIWQHHFGEGIVRTPNNFGELGERPTHPELLDYLATRFMQSGWSLKAMHRLMLLSSTYQQSSIASSEAVRTDPDNRFWGRMNRQRLDAEAIRDSLLAVTGRLDLTQGGPGFADIRVPRRSHYLLTKRPFNGNGPSYFSIIFDQPSPSMICEKRDSSTTAPQALFLLNDPFIVEQAKALAKHLTRETAGQASEARIQKLYALCLGRLPTSAEVDIGLRFLTQEYGAESAPWTEYCHAIFCINEFFYVD